MPTEQPVWAYYLERMDNRQWTTLEESWCVDAGLSYPQNTPGAILSIDVSNGTPTLQQPIVVYGGMNYSDQTYAVVEDPTGRGATTSLVIEGGAISGAFVGGTLTGYTNPTIIVTDPSGLGGGAAINIQSLNLATLTASAPVFSNTPGFGEAGDVVRMGDRRITVTEFVGPTMLKGDVVQQHENTVPDDPFLTPLPQAAGSWSIAAPVLTVYGLNHLEGMLVSILADGIVQNPQIVVNGSITLSQAATAIVVGLGFAAQMQTLYLDIPGGVTVQGRRKEIDQVIVRVANSGVPFEVGINQPDQATSPNMTTLPWANLNGVQGIVQGNRAPAQPYDLNTGDFVAPVFDQLGFTNGQVALQQTAPLPLTVLAVEPWVRIGDDVDQG